LTHIKQQKFVVSHQGPGIKYTVLIISTALDVTEGIFAVFMCQLWALHVVIKKVFLHLYLQFFY